MEIIDDKMLVTLKVSDLRNVIADIFNKSTGNSSTANNGAKNYVYGLSGIARAFGCSIPTALRLKKSGVIDDAITQIGRKIICDSDKALALVAAARKKKMGYEND